MNDLGLRPYRERPAGNSTIGTVFQIRLNRPVKADSRFSGQCRERQPVLVLKHQRTLPTN